MREWIQNTDYGRVTFARLRMDNTREFPEYVQGIVGRVLEFQRRFAYALVGPVFEWVEIFRFHHYYLGGGEGDGFVFVVPFLHWLRIFSAATGS